MAADYTKIDEVINDFQLMIDDTSYDKEAHIYQLRLIALQGLRELKFDVEQEVNTATFVVDSTTLQVTLPSNYLKLLRVGFKGSDGNFHALGSNPNLSLDAGIESQTGSSTNDYNPNYSLDVGRKFGIGGGNNKLGYYRINHNDNTINFSSGLAGKELFLEYLSDGTTYNPGVYRQIKITVGGGSSFEDGDLFTLLYKDNYTGLENNIKIKFDIDSNFNTPDFPYYNTAFTIPVGIDSAMSSTLVADKVSDAVNIQSPYHSSVTSENEITITCNQLVNWSVTEDSMNVTTQEALELPTLGIEVINEGSTSEERAPRVHKFCEEALRAYIYYKYIQRKRGIPANEKQMAKRAFFNEKRLARARMMNFSKETALQTSRKAFKQSPKF